MMYYHGGPRGIVGFIRPAIETGATSCSDYRAAGIHRRDRVYLTTNPNTALMYACGHKSGAVYVVEPIGSVENDPDWLGDPGVSVQCERAKIVAARPVKGSIMRKVRRQVMGVMT